MNMWWYRRKLYLRLAGLAISMMLVGATAWGFNTSRDSAGSTDLVRLKEPDVSGSPSPSSTSTTEDQSVHDSAEELRKSLPELEDFIEKARGLSFKTEVSVDILSGSDFNSKLVEGFEGAGDSIEFRLQALRVIKPDQSLDEILKSFATQRVVGFYDSEAKALYVRGESITTGLKLTLVHELMHALQDQHFGLQDSEEFGDDSGLAYSALVEGDASYVELQYFESLSSDEQDALLGEQFGGGGGDNSILNAIPPLVDTLAFFPYEAGASFVEALVAEGGTAAIDDAYNDPPDSTEEILEPQSYINDVGSESVPIPAIGSVPKETGTLGEAFLAALVGGGGSAFDPFASGGDATGWVGDSFVTYEQGNSACISAVIRFDDTFDRDSFFEQLSQWQSKLRNSSSALVGDRETSFNACAPLSVA